MSKLPKFSLPQKPVYHKIGEGVDFFKLFSYLETKLEKCFLLESLAEDNYDSRYSVIGFDPECQIKATSKIENGELKNLFHFEFDSSFQPHLQNPEDFNLKNNLKFEVQSENPFFDLRQIIPQNIITKNYSGGLVGYFSYETANYLENLRLKIHSDFSVFSLGFYTDGLVFDKFTGEVFYFHFLASRKDLVEKMIQESTSKHVFWKTEIEFLGNSQTKEDHKKAVELVIEEIKKGNTFQCEAGFKSKYKIKGDKLAIYDELRKVNPSPHMFYLKDGEEVVMGASPELLYRQRNGEIETFPLAGTTSRGKNLEEDRILTRQLLNNSKEVAEHLMLVDMHRNDIGRVSKFGTVKVRKLMDIVRYSHVQHISSEISGIIGADKDMFDGLASLLPGGVLNGAPKVESMKIIDKNEPEARGPYGGAVGQLGFNGDATFCIPIRSLFIKNENAFAQTSSGIVLDSKPQEEYQEIENKLAAMKKTLSKFIKTHETTN